MKFHVLALTASALILMVSCGSKITSSDAAALQDIAPDVVDATVQKIGGKGASLVNTPVDFAPFAKLPTVFAQAYAPDVANMLLKIDATKLLNSSVSAALNNLRGGRVQTMQAVGATGCGNDISPIDADQDGIPDSVDYTYNCQSGTILTTGTISIKDTSPNGAGPYVVHIKKLKALDQSNNNSASLNLDLDLKSDTPPYSVAEGISITVKVDDTKTDFATIGFTSSLKYTPNNVQSPFNGQGNADLGASFNFSYKFGTEQANKTFKLTANVHHNQPGCTGTDGEVDSGNVQFSDDSGNYVRTTAVACNSSGWGWETNVK